MRLFSAAVYNAWLKNEQEVVVKKAKIRMSDGTPKKGNAHQKNEVCNLLNFCS